MKPLAIDLFCGLGGWTEGLLAEGYNVVGFDIERRPYPAQLVIQDALTLHGSQFRDAALIVASPPCQEFSYMAMPWSRAKKIAAEYRAGIRDVAKLKALFNACIRIQIEASHEAGRYIPLVIENVRGAQPWVGQAKANFGSFYLWGDVGMVGRRVVGIRPQFGGGVTARAVKVAGLDWSKFGTENYKPQGFNVVAAQRYRAEQEGQKVPGMNFHDFEKTGQPGRSFQSAAVRQISLGWRAKHYGETDKMQMAGDGMQFRQSESEAVKIGGDWFSDPQSPSRKWGSKSDSCKAASAAIAKIPFPLAQHIARAYYPRTGAPAVSVSWGVR